MVHTQCSVTASLMTTVTHYRFFHCYYLQERKTVKNLIFLISFFERYRKLPFISTQHHFLFINFVRGKKRGRQKMVKTKNYYKNSHYLIIALNTKTDHSFSVLVGKSKLFCQFSMEQLAEKWYSTSKHSVYKGQWSIEPSKFWHFWRPGTIGINAFWKGSPLYATYKQGQRLVTEPRQILEESVSVLQVKEALPKKEEDVSVLQSQINKYLQKV